MELKKKLSLDSCNVYIIISSKTLEALFVLEPSLLDLYNSFQLALNISFHMLCKVLDKRGTYHIGEAWNMKWLVSSFFWFKL